MAAGLSSQGVTTWTVCSGRCDFSSIQEAIDAASGGDTIEVREGTYRETLQILKTLTITGEGTDNVTLEGSVSVLGGIAVTMEGLTITRATGSRPAAVQPSPSGT
jgi:pectin methylesterase-like acyl-CoA thioesterase